MKIAELSREILAVQKRIAEKRKFAGRCLKRLARGNSADPGRDRRALGQVEKQIDALEERVKDLFRQLGEEKRKAQAAAEAAAEERAARAAQARSNWAQAQLEELKQNPPAPSWDGRYQVDLQGPGISGILVKSSLEEVREYFLGYV